MQRRSWMAALTMTGVALAAPTTWAEGQTTTTPTPAAVAAKGTGQPASVRRKVALNLHLKGLVYQSEVTVTPGNAACRFAPQTIPIRSTRYPTSTKPIEVEVLTADRSCSLVLTIKEAGQPPQTIRRNFQIEPADPANPTPQVFDCYLSGASTLNAGSIARRPTETPATKK